MAIDNKTLAEHARQLADQHPGGSPERRAAGCAGVALGTTRSVTAARTALREHLTGDVLDRALRVLDDISGGDR